MNKQTWIRLCIAGAALLIGMSVLGPSRAGEKSPEPIHKSSFLLNTFVDITLYDSNDTSILDHAMDICKDYEARFSRTMETSEIYKLNHRAPGETVFSLSEETAALLSEALQYCELSDGAFDITIEPLSSLWDFSGGKKEIPDPEDISRAAQKVDYKNLRLEGNTLTFLSPDTTLDLGAIAKGYIADRIKDYLTEAGVKSAIINLGGNVLCVGGRPDGSPFQIGLRKPFADRTEVIGNMEITDLSMVTSGVYERHFVINGKNYHHLLNPQTGYPYENGLISVTILSSSSSRGDGLSTVCFSLGLEGGMELINSMEGVYACFIDENYNLYYSDGMENFIQK